MKPTPDIQADFDRIALLSQEGWSHNGHYHGYLLSHFPRRCEAALEIGCGTGAFARLLAQRADRVVALDLSPRMIETAKARSQDHPNIAFQVADAASWPFPAEAFDCVACIATLHHLPNEETLLKMSGALRVGGTLGILDLFKGAGMVDVLQAMVAMPASVALSLAKNRRVRDSRPVREAWAAHGRNDVYPSLADVRHICKRVLPGARVRRHLFWRYSIIWTKKAGSQP